jgi:hypothetical protein
MGQIADRSCVIAPIISLASHGRRFKVISQSVRVECGMVRDRKI